MFIFNHIIGSNYGYMRVSPIGIGNDLHPVVYGLIIIAIFNALIVFMNSLMNRQQKEQHKLNETLRINKAKTRRYYSSSFFCHI